ncbi:hypothetical protein GALMADRAFT_251984 [Galerina marginata CBS 339.88]|uniref:FAD-binding domain-containing protein n=1 Tax=Galerina marginata (strain CBS 339.88) TaxID=685588 RepID=A0A067SQZ0_GALM3|nr:hypothetical protein GALMADRAFT_251984 [Galerina marginata CBS 339.88]
MLPERTSVLIVGAGPAGLAAAISLFHHGCKDIVIVDAVERTPDTSRAMAIHAATLEALESIGCADKLVELGIKGETLNIWNRTARFFTLDVSVLSQYTKYPYVLLLPQNKTEDVLEEHLKGLGISVQRPYKAVGIKGDVDELGNTEVLFESGEIIKAQYTIGADGSRSAIRQLSGIGFADPDGLPVDESLAQIVLADVTFSKECPTLPTNNVIATIHGGAFFLLIPLQKWRTDISNTESQDAIYRIGFNVPAALGPPPSKPSLEYLQDHLNSQGPLNLSSDPTVNPNPISITKSLWATRFRTHAAIADKFVFRLHARDETFGGHIILIGDAAHIHSPAGGQGMNLGIRDAIALGSALVAHMNQTNSPDTSGSGNPLEVHGETRRKSALSVIRLTKRIMGVVTTLGTTSVVDLPYWILRTLGAIPAVRRMIAWQVSGLGNR